MVHLLVVVADRLPFAVQVVLGAVELRRGLADALRVRRRPSCSVVPEIGDCMIELAVVLPHGAVVLPQGPIGLMQIVASAVERPFVLAQLVEIVLQLRSIARRQVVLDRALITTHRVAIFVHIVAIAADRLPLVVIRGPGLVEARFIMANRVTFAVLAAGCRCRLVRGRGRWCGRRTMVVVPVLAPFAMPMFTAFGMMVSAAATGMVPTAVTAAATHVPTACVPTAAATAGMPAAMGMNCACGDCQSAANGQRAEKFPHDATPYAFQM